MTVHEVSVRHGHSKMHPWNLVSILNKSVRLCVWNSENVFVFAVSVSVLHKLLCYRGCWAQAFIIKKRVKVFFKYLKDNPCFSLSAVFVVLYICLLTVAKQLPVLKEIR